MTKQLLTVAQIAEFLGASYEGDGHCVITSIAPLEIAEEGQISFLDNSKYRKFLTETKASAVILNAKEASLCPAKAKIITDKPYLAYAKAAGLFIKPRATTAQIHPKAVIGTNCQIDATASIAANVVIGNNVTIAKNVVIGANTAIGDDCQIAEETQLAANVTLYNDITIGKRALIHSGVVIGADGFGFAQAPEGWFKVPQLGGVRIGDDVEIGANTTIDRGALGDTVIGNGVKLDNQIQIGHNVKIGDHTIIAGCTAVAGSVTIGKQCMIAGKVCIAGHLSIGDRIIITGMTGISKSLTEPGVYSSGMQAERYELWKRNAIQISHLSEIAQRLKKLEQLIAIDDNP